MPRYTICATADNPEERQHFQAWLKQWKSQLQYVSKNYGCGCCVDMYDIEGPATAIDKLPPHLLASSEWTREGKKTR